MNLSVTESYVLLCKPKLKLDALHSKNSQRSIHDYYRVTKNKMTYSHFSTKTFRCYLIRIERLDLGIIEQQPFVLCARRAVFYETIVVSTVRCTSVYCYTDQVILVLFFLAFWLVLFQALLYKCKTGVRKRSAINAKQSGTCAVTLFTLVVLRH